MNRNEKERVGATLRFAREARGVSQTCLAQRLHISQSYLANIEAGRKPLPPQLLKQICNLLKVPAIVLVNPDFYDEPQPLTT